MAFLGHSGGVFRHAPSPLHRANPALPVPLAGRMAKVGLALGAAVALLALSGCAASGAMTLMSLGASGISLAVSGKSLSDHALSVVLNRDCALWRPVNGEAVCRRPNAATEVLVSNAVELGAEKTTPTQAYPFAYSLENSYRPQRRVDGSAQSHITAAPLVEDAESVQIFAVLGSFKERGNARRLAHTIGDGTDVRIVAAALAVGVRHRVMLGPVGASSTAFYDEMARRGMTEAWPLSLCVPSLRVPPCVEEGRLLAVAR